MRGPLLLYPAAHTSLKTNPRTRLVLAAAIIPPFGVAETHPPATHYNRSSAH